MNAHAGIEGVKPPTHKQLLGNLRSRMVDALGVNAENQILDHAVSQVCFELETIAAALTAQFKGLPLNPEACGFALRGIIDRLQLARDLQGGMWDPEHPEQTIILKNGGEP